uniref:Reverse transcriptase domain-containing protein n=1 Tax=Nothobranchius rachovii TaxID=451742 RepID=A0A1A8S175_9TELE
MNLAIWELVAPPEPETQFNSAEPTLKEVEEAVRAARSSSAPGPRGIPSKVYKQCLKLLRRLWKFIKGGVPGVPGCLEHTGVVTQLIREAKEGKGDLAVIWLDLANAYGSIPHKLVKTELWKAEPVRIKFLVKSVYDILPSQANQHTWGLADTPDCKLRQKRGTLEHILSSCSNVLGEGHYRWRHDQFQVDVGRQLKFPANITAMPLHPDMVITSESIKQVVILELTVSWEDCIEETHERKRAKYAELSLECWNNGWKVCCEPVEVGCRGFAGNSLLRTLKLLGVRGLQLKKATKTILEAAERASRWLWIRRGDPWSNRPLGHKLGTDHTQLGCPGEGV